MGGDVPKPFPDLEPDKNGQPDKDVKPTDEIKPEIKPEPEQFDNNTPCTKEEWFKSKWKTGKILQKVIKYMVKRRIPEIILWHKK